MLSRRDGTGCYVPGMVARKGGLRREGRAATLRVAPFPARDLPLPRAPIDVEAWL